MELQNKRYTHIDLLRILSMFSVIFLHVVADLLRVNFKEGVWHFANVLTAFMSTSVPIFFMISGALLLSGNKTLSVSYTLKKRLPKVFCPFLFWSLTAVVYHLLTGYFYYGHKWNFTPTLYRLSHLPSQPITIHLWFLYALIPIYLISPLLKAMMDKLSKAGQNYMIFLWVVFSVLIPSIRTYVPESLKIYFTLSGTYTLNLFSGYIGFFLLGYLLNTRSFRIKNRTLFLFILGDIFLVSLATYLYTTYQGEYYEGFKTYSLVFTASMSAALFLLVKNLWENWTPGKTAARLLSVLSASSFAIYLMHNLVIHFMSLNYFIVPNRGIGASLLRFLAVFAISFGITVLLASIRPLCYPATGISYTKACESFNLQFYGKVIGRQIKKLTNRT